MRPALASVVAGTAMSSVVAGTLYLTGGPAHIISEIELSGPLYLALILSFSVQVAMMAARHNRRAIAANSAGSGAVMIACCAHHAADIAPLAGLLPILAPLATYQQGILFAGTLLSLGATAWMASRHAARTDAIGSIAKLRYPLVALVATALTITTYGALIL